MKIRNKKLNFENTVFLIPARKGSKGLPFKNRMLFPITAKIIPEKYKKKVYISTDDEYLKEAANKHGFNIVERPQKLAQDTTGMRDVLTHFRESENLSKNTNIILLYLTYPERTWRDICDIYSHFTEEENDSRNSLICCENVDEHPYLCFEYDEKTQKGKLIIDHQMYRRQDYPLAVKQSMFVACYKSHILDSLHNLMFEEDTIFYKLKDKKVDVDYEKDYNKTLEGKMIADERFYPKELEMSFDPFIRHYERYFQCVKILGKIGRNEKWLDCACGTGYGSNFLANFCESVVGYDIDSDTVEYANREYKSKKISFMHSLSKNNHDSYDVIFSVETIEHMPESDASVFLQTLKSLLKDDGALVITTPIVPKTNYSPKNKFHDVEYSHEHFVDLLASNGFEIDKTNFVTTTFTDGEVKDQGYYKCKKAEEKNV
jgi:CMP-N-acetylneuraminic acid synthetase/SAM-dependent methyltransferase